MRLDVVEYLVKEAGFTPDDLAAVSFAIEDILTEGAVAEKIASENATIPSEAYEVVEALAKEANLSVADLLEVRDAINEVVKEAAKFNLETLKGLASKAKGKLKNLGSAAKGKGSAAINKITAKINKVLPKNPSTATRVATQAGVLAGLGAGLGSLAKRFGKRKATQAASQAAKATTADKLRAFLNNAQAYAKQHPYGLAAGAGGLG